MVLKVVLFTNGVGADPTKYRPDADDSQWWNRRDALVRCVSAFLCGPQALPPLSTIHNNHHHHHHVDNTTMSAHGGGGSRELVIVHDQDWSCLHLSYHHPNDTSPTVPPLRLPMLVPTERNVIAVWKRAAKFPGKLIQENGLSCRLVVSDIPTISPFDSAATTTTTNVDYTKSKRDLLEYLQATCSIDFLRQHK